MYEQAAGTEKSTAHQKALLVIVVNTEILFARLVLASPCSEEVQYCCRINIHQIILMKSNIMLKAHIHVG